MYSVSEHSVIQYSNELEPYFIEHNAINKVSYYAFGIVFGHIQDYFCVLIVLYHSTREFHSKD